MSAGRYTSNSQGPSLLLKVGRLSIWIWISQVHLPRLLNHSMAEGWSRFAVRFSDYYNSISTGSIWTPPRFRSREWMFIPWGNLPPTRHVGFGTKPELHNYLKMNSPHSCFHSTAYYADPFQTKMVDKGWKGADLIFDLDGDHLPGVSDRDFPSMLELIQ